GVSAEAVPVRQARLAGGAVQAERFFPDQLPRVIGKGETLGHGKLVEIYEDDESIAKRILAEWDGNKDGTLTVAELKSAASRTDGKISLGALDPGASAAAFQVKDVLKACWELFIVGLILFFVTAAINQVARQKQAQLDEAEIAKLEISSGRARRTEPRALCAPAPQRHLRALCWREAGAVRAARGAVRLGSSAAWGREPACRPGVGPLLVGGGGGGGAERGRPAGSPRDPRGGRGANFPPTRSRRADSHFGASAGRAR
ncbi:unnamed protein product, partial [Prorocentrum cordatum]